MIRAAKSLVLILWLISAAWLIRFEAFPEFFSGSTLSYRNLIGQNVLLRESWHKVSMKEKDIGYVSTVIESQDEAQQVSYQITSKTHINLGLPVRTDDIVLETTVRLDASYALLSLDSDLQAPGVNVKNMLERNQAGGFTATTFRTDLDSSTSREVSLPPSAVVFLPPTDLLPPRLRPGIKSYMRIIDPISLETSVIEVETVSSVPGIPAAATEKYHWTKLQHKGMDFLCARDESDEIAGVRAPLGITLTKCTVDEAFAAAGIDDPDAAPTNLDPERVIQYVESLVGPLSSVLSVKAKNRNEND